MAAFTAYDIVGKKEDVSDIISNIDPTKTPFQSTIGTERVSNTLFQWQEDSLAAVDLNNARVQGFTASDATLTTTTMRSNYTQILSKTINIAETTDAVSTYGRAKETSLQLAKAAAELKRDLEGIMLSGQAAAVGNSGSAATFAAYQSQINANLRVATGGAATAMTETLLLSTLQTMYGYGADPSLLMVPPGEAITIANYAAASGRYRVFDNNDAGSRKIVNVVDLYVSPFGELKVVLNRFQLNTDYLIFDPANWKQCVLRPWTKENLAKVGDSHRIMMVGEFSLKHNNQKASAVIRKVTGSGGLF